MRKVQRIESGGLLRLCSLVGEGVGSAGVWIEAAIVMGEPITSVTGDASSFFGATATVQQDSSDGACRTCRSLLPASGQQGIDAFTSTALGAGVQFSQPRTDADNGSASSTDIRTQATAFTLLCFMTFHTLDHDDTSVCDRGHVVDGAQPVWLQQTGFPIVHP